MADLADIIARVWKTHHDDPDGAAEALAEAQALVEADDHASRYAAAVNHVIGQQHGRWGEAAERLAAVAGRLEADAPALFLAHLAVALHLAGDAPGALTAQLRAGARGGDAAAADAAVALLVAEAAEPGERRDALLDAALLAAEALDGETFVDRNVAVCANNTTSALLESPRGPDRDVTLLRGAQVARAFWARAGTWVNVERADYLLALVHNALGRFEDARAAAESALALIDDNDGDEPVDRAFLHLALARAAQGLEEPDAYTDALAAADALAEGFEADWLKAWYGEERDKVVD